MKKILIIEDDQEINNTLKQLLEVNNYQVVQAFSETDGILLHNHNISLILLDFMLPGRHVEEMTSQLMLKNPVPIIGMNETYNISKKVDLFHFGIDDYITKPLNHLELLAKIELQLKHCRKNKMFVFKDITLDIQNDTVTCNLRNVNLTKCECELLKALMEQPDRVFTSRMLFQIVCGEDATDNDVLIHISKIRNKLKDCNPNMEYIEIIGDHGYKMKN